MGMIKNLRCGWKSMTAVEKVKFLLSFGTQVGAGVLVGDIALNNTKNCGPVERAFCVLGGWGLGMAAGDIAGKATEEFVDNLVFLNEARKEEKAKKTAQQEAQQ